MKKFIFVMKNQLKKEKMLFIDSKDLHSKKYFRK